MSVGVAPAPFPPLSLSRTQELAETVSMQTGCTVVLSVDNTSFDISAMDIDNVSRAKLLIDMQDGVGLQAKPLTSSIYKNSQGLTTVRVEMDIPFHRKDIFRELISKK